MSLLSIFGCGRAKTPEYPADRLSARDGTEFTITFFKHASLAISVGGKYIYVDPVSANADYGALPKADVVLITHSHYDHLDVAAVEKLLAAEPVQTGEGLQKNVLRQLFGVLRASGDPCGQRVNRSSVAIDQAGAETGLSARDSSDQFLFFRLHGYSVRRAAAEKVTREPCFSVVCNLFAHSASNRAEIAKKESETF